MEGHDERCLQGDSSKKRLILHVKDPEILSLVVSKIESTGSAAWFGPKPPGYLEDAAQKLLEK